MVVEGCLHCCVHKRRLTRQGQDRVGARLRGSCQVGVLVRQDNIYASQGLVMYSRAKIVCNR